MAPQEALFTPLTVGAFDLEHRVVLAPLTRCRAIGRVPQPQAVLYYAQRTSKGGLLISEGTSPSPTGHGNPHVPGIYTEEQVEAWMPITQAVKDKGGVFFCQIWHVGRASHNEYQPDGAAPISSSPTAIKGEITTESGKRMPYPVPHALTPEEMPEVVADYVKAARNAIAAGFDGVEIHGANGYLIEQFIKDGINKRTDEFGGSIENRARFPLEIIAAVVAEIGGDRVGVRFSPFSTFQDASDSDEVGAYMYVLSQLNPLGLAYIHLVESRITGSSDHHGHDKTKTLEPFRKMWKGPFMAAGGFGAEDGAKAVESGAADLIAYGRWFISNPDLPKRLRLHAKLHPYDRATFYIQDPVKGYTDQPFLEDEEAGETPQTGGTTETPPVVSAQG